MENDDRGGWKAGSHAECWLVSGRVQGVGFRYHVSRAAASCGVEGDVRNLPDGRVEVRVRTGGARLEPFRELVRQGPPGARVDDIEVRPVDEPVTFDGFQVRF